MGELAGNQRPPRAPALPCQLPPRTNPPEPANAFTCISRAAMLEQHACLLLSRAEPVLPDLFDFRAAESTDLVEKLRLRGPCTTAAFLSATPSPRFLLSGAGARLPVDVAMPCFLICAWCSPSLCANRDPQPVPLLPCFVCCFLLSERLHLRPAGAIGMTSNNKGCVFGALKCALSAIIYRAAIALVPLICEQQVLLPFAACRLPSCAGLLEHQLCVWHPSPPGMAGRALSSLARHERLFLYC